MRPATRAGSPYQLAPGATEVATFRIEKDDVDIAQRNIRCRVVGGVSSCSRESEELRGAALAATANPDRRRPDPERSRPPSPASGGAWRTVPASGEGSGARRPGAGCVHRAECAP